MLLPGALIAAVEHVGDELRVVTEHGAVEHGGDVFDGATDDGQSRRDDLLVFRGQGDVCGLRLS